MVPNQRRRLVRSGTRVKTKVISAAKSIKQRVNAAKQHMRQTSKVRLVWRQRTFPSLSFPFPLLLSAVSQAASHAVSPGGQIPKDACCVQEKVGWGDKGRGKGCLMLEELWRKLLEISSQSVACNEIQPRGSATRNSTRHICYTVSYLHKELVKKGRQISALANEARDQGQSVKTHQHTREQPQGASIQGKEKNKTVRTTL